MPEPGGQASSARNRSVGLVTNVRSDPVMSQLDLQCRPYLVSSLMSTEGVEELKLEVSKIATASIEATRVVVEADRKVER